MVQKVASRHKHIIKLTDIPYDNCRSEKCTNIELF